MGVLPLSTDGNAPLRFIFWKEVTRNRDGNSKIFSKFSTFFPNFSKIGTLRGTVFSLFVFLRPYLGRWKKVPWPPEHPRTPFCPSTPPGCNSFSPDSLTYPWPFWERHSCWAWSREISSTIFVLRLNADKIGWILYLGTMDDMNNQSSINRDGLWKSTGAWKINKHFILASNQSTRGSLSQAEFSVYWAKISPKLRLTATLTLIKSQ